MRSTQTKKAICLRKARFSPCLPFIYRFFSLPTAQKICAIKIRRTKKLLPQFRQIVCLVGALRALFFMFKKGTVFAVPFFYISLF